MYSIYIQKSKCYIVPLYDCKFWQLEGADPIYTVYIWKPSKLQRLLFQNNDREIQDTFRFLRIIACLQIAVEEDNDSLKKRMSMHKPHSSSLCSLSDCVCNCVLERICGESDMSEMHVLCVRIPPNLDNWARWPISSSADAVIQRQDTSTLYNASCKEKFETNLHQTPAPSDPEVFSRLFAAAAAEALTMGLLMPSETSLSRQLWAYSRRSSSASARKFPKPDSDGIGSLLRNSVSWNLIGRNAPQESWTLSTPLLLGMLFLYLYHPWNKFKTKVLCIFNAAKFVGICWHHKLKEPNMSCTWTGLQLAFLPLSPMAASETWQQRVAKIRCIGCIGLGCTWMYMDVQCILASCHLVARVPLSSCYQ